MIARAASHLDLMSAAYTPAELRASPKIEPRPAISGLPRSDC
jgi:hypothetical protein